LSGAAVAAAVVRDDPEPAVHEEQHLRVPVIGAERPAVVKNDRLRVLRTPILEEEGYSIARLDRIHGVRSCTGSRVGGRSQHTRSDNSIAPWCRLTAHRPAPA